LFDVVVSAYHRDGFEPSEGVEYHRVLFEDAELTPESKALAGQAARLVLDRLLEGKSVLVRCQAGLNRSSLIAGLAMVGLGFEGSDAVQLIRSRRSPWALCNEEYADFIMGLSAGALTVSSGSEGTGKNG
jgi:protein-tyrosine phosphatase